MTAAAGARMLAAGAAVLLAAGAPPAGAGDWQPQMAEIARAETILKLPARAHATVGDYRRFYAGTTVDGQRVLRGVWLRQSGKPLADGGVTVVASAHALPVVFDGGCGVIEVRFTPATGAGSADCHGYG